MYTTHYSNPGSLVGIDLGIIGGAKKTLDIAAYALEDSEIVQAIAQAGARGAAVRLYLDRTELEAAARGDATLGRWPGHVLMGAANVQIKVKESSILMHLKSYCVDSAQLRDGSANFSLMGEIEQDNSLTVTDDAAAVAAFQAKFEAMWARPDNLSPSQAVQPRTTGTAQAFHPARRAH